jgi:hypothetical protein
MPWLEQIRKVVENLQAAADAVGKSLWVLVAGFVIVAIATGHPALLGAIRDRLVLAGVTSLKTPFGEVNPEKIGRLDTSSRVIGNTAARVTELAASATDSATKQALEVVASELKGQQHVQVEALAEAVANARAKDAGATPAGTGDAERWIYIGRYSGSKWSPASFSLAEAAYPVKVGDTLVVKSDAVLYETVDCKQVDTPRPAAAAEPPPLTFIKASPAGIEVMRPPKECPSIGGAVSVWAKVKVPARLLISGR